MKNNIELENRTSNASMALESGQPIERLDPSGSAGINEGLDYILSHFTGQSQLFPRTVSSNATENRQVPVKNIEDTLDRFEQANYRDCRISAYPLPSKLSSFVGVNLNLAPSVVMIDLDRETFKTEKAFETTLTRTLRKIRETIISEPTVIWSGSGYHIYLVLDAFVLETEDAFNNSKFGSNPSQKFLRFGEWFLSNGKCDPQHNNTVSLRNCMLRIPGSVNSKNDQTVRVVKRWDGFKPSIHFLLGTFHAWLVNQRITEMPWKRQISCRQRQQGGNIQWIENLLNTPIDDYRKLAIWHIFVPYLLNIRGLSHTEAHGIIMEWLKECDKLRRLDFTPSYKIKGALNSSKDFLPVSCGKLKTENKSFYDLLLENRVL
jgi:hypothetical protein